jgi:hypothetical protein
MVLYLSSFISFCVSFSFLSSWLLSLFLMIIGRWWLNDPDCLLLRDTGTGFSSIELLALITIKAFSGGSLLVSDDLAAVPPGRLSLLRALLPVTGRTPVVIDLLDRTMPELMRLDISSFDTTRVHTSAPYDLLTPLPCALPEWTLLAICNWSECETVPRVEGSRCLGPACQHASLVHRYEFWTGAYACLALCQKTAMFLSPVLPAHAAAVYAMRPQRPAEPVYIGSNIHFSCGLEVQEAVFRTNVRSCLHTFNQSSEVDFQPRECAETSSVSSYELMLHGWANLSPQTSFLGKGLEAKFVVLSLPLTADKALVLNTVGLQRFGIQCINVAPSTVVIDAIDYLDAVTCVVCKITLPAIIKDNKITLEW